MAAEEEKDQDEFLFRINNVFTFIKANEATQLISSYTLGDYIDQAINLIEGPKENGRASRKERLENIRKDLDYVINTLS